MEMCSALTIKGTSLRKTFFVQKVKASKYELKVTDFVLKLPHWFILNLEIKFHE